MAALTENTDRLMSDLQLEESPRHMDVNANSDASVASGVQLGSIVYLDAVTLRATLITNAGANTVMGIAENFVATTAAATTTKPLRVRAGMLARLVLAGVVEGDIGKLVHATTDNDINITATGSRLGILHEIISGTTVTVRIRPTA
jgi:hypothetical protein